MPTPAININIDGAPVSATLEVFSMEIKHEVNRVPYAEVVFRSSLPAPAAKAQTELFAPGQRIFITLGTQGNPLTERLVFRGIITSYGTENGQAGRTIRIEARHAAFMMTQRRTSAVYRDSLDSEVFEEIFARYGTVPAEVLAVTEGLHPELVQYYCTDWDFVLSRADANGLLVVPSPELVKIMMVPEVEVSANPTHLFDVVTMPIYDMQFSLNGDKQFDVAEAFGFNYETQSMEPPGVGEGPNPNPGIIEPQQVAVEEENLQNKLVTGASRNTTEMEAWARGSMVRSRLSFFSGSIRTDGNAALEPGQSAELAGMGVAFDGGALISGVTQHISNSGWRTTVHFGVSSRPYAEQFNVQAPPAAGLVPGIHGLQIGIVMETIEDPLGQFRVRVKLPVLNDPLGTVMARIAHPDAGSGPVPEQSRGFFFRPEIGDEVVLGFLNDDPRNPVILGSLYNLEHIPPLPVEPANLQRAIVSKSGSKLQFDDELRMVTLETMETMKISMSEEDGLLEIKDIEGDNSILMSEAGITISNLDNTIQMGEAGITIQSGDNIIQLGEEGIVITGAPTLDIVSEGDVSVTGAAIEITGEGDLSMEAAGAVEVTAGADLNLAAASVQVEGAEIELV